MKSSTQHQSPYVETMRERSAWIGYQTMATLTEGLPPRITEPLIRFAARRAVTPNFRVRWARTLAQNLNVVHGGKMEANPLCDLARLTLETRLRAHFEVLRMARHPETLSSLVFCAPAVESWLRQHRLGGRGVMLVAPHTGNFDLAVRALAGKIPDLLILVAPDAHSGYAFEHQIRRRHGLQILPLSSVTLRRACRHLSSGGTVITGIDRPIPGAAPAVCFFGRPAPLSISPLRLAAQADVPLALFWNLRQADGRYCIRMDQPVEIQANGRDRQDLIRIADRLFLRLESVIRSAPGQWTMFQKVWPDPPPSQGVPS